MFDRALSRSLLSFVLAFTSVAFAGDLDDIEKPEETDRPPVVVPQPTPQPPTAQPPTAQPPAIQPPGPNQASDGVMAFGARLIANMEHGFHIMDHGYKAVCVDSQGVVAQARMDIYAAINGEVRDSQQGGYTPVTLRPSLEYVRQGATSGSCQLKVCLPQGNPTLGQDIACDPMVLKGGMGRPDPERPVEYKEANVPYFVSGKDIELKTKFATVSAFHPAYSFAAPGKAFKDYQSPLVLDMSGKGKLDLVDVWDSRKEIRFDLIADGAAVRTGWIGKQAAFLALDHNKNGRIDNGLELFGEYTEGAKTRQDGKRWDNGFLALGQYDLNRDGAIDAKDEIFSKLVVWQDKNQDGKSQKRELLSMQSAKVKSISLAYAENMVDGKPEKVEGNEVRLISVITKSDGTKQTIADVWFRQRRFADRPVASSDFSK